MPVGSKVKCRARGSFRHNNMTPLAGDNVTLLPAEATQADANGQFVIDEIVDRKNSLIRPPLANLDYLFITLAAASPKPVLSTVDKLISIAEFNEIEPIIVITKCELDFEYAKKLIEIAKKKLASYKAINKYFAGTGDLVAPDFETLENCFNTEDECDDKLKALYLDLQKSKKAKDFII